MDDPRFFEREPSKDELALGYAWGQDEEGELFQLKGVPREDRLTHFYVIGASGTGKTKFLEYLINQDAKNGFGFGVIDPHGDLVEDVKSRLPSSGLESRAVLIDPTDGGRTVCFNPLELGDGVSPAEQAAELTLAFKKIWADAWGARMEDILRNSFVALIENGLTLAELPLLLSDEAVRGKIAAGLKNETAADFFRKFGSWNKTLKTEWTESTLNKVNAFLSDERVRDMFLSPQSSFSFREIMDEGKILLVKLDKGKLKGASDLLGSLILTKLQMAAFSRTDVRETERKPFYLYIDEFQNFATDSFIDILSESRKYRLALTLANQNLAQLPSELRASILGNCGLQAYFRLSRFDAELLAKEAFGGVNESEDPQWEKKFQLLQALPRQVCLVKNKAQGGIVLIRVPDAPLGKLRPRPNAGLDYLREREEIRNEYSKRREALLADDGPEEFRRKK